MPPGEGTSFVAQKAAKVVGMPFCRAGFDVQCGEKEVIFLFRGAVFVCAADLWAEGADPCGVAFDEGAYAFEKTLYFKGGRVHRII